MEDSDTIRCITFFDLEQIIVFAVNEKGEDVFIDHAENGKMCNLFCRYCGNPMVAKNGGNIKRHHFAHVDGSDCKKGHEAQLPKICLEIMKSEMSFNLPQSNITLKGERLFEKRYFNYSTVCLEKYSDNDIPLVVFTRKDEKKMYVLLSIKNNGDMVDEIRRDSNIDNALEINFAYYKGSNYKVYDIIKEVFQNQNYDDWKIKWIKNEYDEPIKKKIQELATWKCFRTNNKGQSLVYCPKSKEKFIEVGKINSDCNSCPYSLSNIIENEYGYYYLDKKCIGYIGDELTVQSIMNAQKIDYSELQDPTLPEDFDESFGDSQRLTSEQLKRKYPNKTIKVQNTYNKSIYLLHFDTTNNVVTKRKYNSNGVLSKEVIYDPSDAFNSWVVLEVIENKNNDK